MVKKFELTQIFQCSIAEFFKILLSNQNFEEEVHISRGNKNISVTPWMASGSNVSQRLCFYTIVDNDKNGIGSSLCKETQTFRHENESLCMECAIVPDNPSVGNIFRIQSYWKIISLSGNQCSLTITGEVECKKSVLGIQSMVENILAEKFRGSYLNWTSCAVVFVEKFKQKEEEEMQKERMKQQESSVMSFLGQNKSRLHRRWQSLQTRVMAGTENIVRLLQDGARVSAAKLSEKSLHSPSAPTQPSHRTEIEHGGDVVIDLNGDFGKSESGTGGILGGILSKTGKDKESDEETPASNNENVEPGSGSGNRYFKLIVPSKFSLLVWFIFFLLCVFVYWQIF